MHPLVVACRMLNIQNNENMMYHENYGHYIIFIVFFFIISFSSAFFCALVENAIFSYLKLQSREKWRSLKVVVFFPSKEKKRRRQARCRGTKNLCNFSIWMQMWWCLHFTMLYNEFHLACGPRAAPAPAEATICTFVKHRTQSDGPRREEKV